MKGESDPERPPGGSRRDLFGALAIIVATAALAFGPGLVARFSAHPSRPECQALLTRYSELKQRAISEKSEPAVRQAALDAAARTTGPSLAGCTTELTLAEAACARGAGNADDFERCLR